MKKKVVGFLWSGKIIFGTISIQYHGVFQKKQVLSFDHLLRVVQTCLMI